MPNTRSCQCGLTGCTQCAHGYHCGPCALAHREARERRTIAHHAARKRARREAHDNFHLSLRREASQ